MDLKASLEPPKFQSPEEERRHRKQRLAAAFRVFARYGFDEGVAGHITARDPKLTDHFWVNPFGQYFGTIKASDLILVNHAGEVVEGHGAVNAAAFAIHSAVHRARPEVVAAAHTHSLYGKAWSALGQLLDPINQDACIFYRDHALMTEYTGVVIDSAEGDRIAQTLGQNKAIILQNHGLLTVGQSVDEAAFWFIAMERACQAQLLAQAAGTPQLIKPHFAELTHQQIGLPLAGWFCFQPLWEMILRDEPDCLN
ncbi:MAG: class II aldolase/adducin family protein [Sulfobacillus acidophilus]|uniref:Class II aldolase/adducin family protein n=1 Tax=Sulfobacillus acidophilus TaxID=53633 RepID=A0A2T2WFD2_9FIRM|nr:MAG: class II aldolase/adducin family protein [Sulfobacillus acidophilus]